MFKNTLYNGLSHAACQIFAANVLHLEPYNDIFITSNSSASVTRNKNCIFTNSFVQHHTMAKRSKLEESSVTQPKSLVETLKEQYNCKKFSDFTIVAFDKEYFVHKMVLSRSEYFNTLFNSNWAIGSVFEFKVSERIFG